MVLYYASFLSFYLAGFFRLALLSPNHWHLSSTLLALASVESQAVGVGFEGDD